MASETNSNSAKTSKEKALSFSQHLEELRLRLIYSLIGLGIATVAALFFCKKILNFFLLPFFRMFSDQTNRASIIFTGPAEAFSALLKVSLLVGLALAMPYVVWQFWLFLRPGLYPRERRFVYLFVPFALAMFYGGLAFCYFTIVPVVIRFLVGLAAGTQITAMLRVSEYISFVFNLMLVFGLAFQLPVAMILLSLARIVPSSWFASKRRYSIAVITLLSAVLTPQDILSMVLLAAPLCVLYELGILLGRVAEKMVSRSDGRAGDDSATS